MCVVYRYLTHKNRFVKCTLVGIALVTASNSAISTKVYGMVNCTILNIQYHVNYLHVNCIFRKLDD